MSGWLKIEGGRVYDPANGVAGERRAIWVRDGRVSEAPADPAAEQVTVLDAGGRIVMPGGVDMHCHIAGPKVNAARRLRPDMAAADERLRKAYGEGGVGRSGTAGPTPSSFATGLLYSALGYTTAFDAAMPPAFAELAHLELADTPLVDAGFFALSGNNEFLLRQIAAGETETATAALGWLVSQSGALATKVVNPGGVVAWKSGAKDAGEFGEPCAYGLSPREIVRGISGAVDRLGLPHPVHVHCNHLGMPGNSAITKATIDALEDRRGHLTHIQFHSYAGDPSDQSTIASAVPELAGLVNARPNLSVDVGQVMFGETTSLTGDGPLGHYLHQVTGRKWHSSDAELESACGVVPITYSNKRLVSALQWAIGLEWHLLVEDPWRIALSTDHPNGASFLAYPEVIALLMSADRRREVLDRCPAEIRERTTLADLDREYDLAEIAILTRAAPARLLGLSQKGHLGPGADADITIYNETADPAEMFATPWRVLKSGRTVIRDGEVDADAWAEASDPVAAADSVLRGRSLRADVSYDAAALKPLEELFAEARGIRFEDYGLGEAGLPGAVEVPTRPAG